MNSNNSERHLLTKSRWEKHIKGFNIIDCAIWDSQQLVFIAKEDVDDETYDVLMEGASKTRVITTLITDDETKIANAQHGGFRFPRVTIERKTSPIILVSSRDSEGDVYYVNTNRKDGMESITPEVKPGPTGSSFTRKLKCIDGWAYAVGQGRCVFKRTATNQWEPVLNGLIWPEGMSTADMGFSDIHGPDESNMYAVGGCGDVWHHDGAKWQWCDFPSNEQLSAVVVAPNGDVYISGEGGSLWRGQLHTWEKIYTGGSSVLNKDLVWYQDQLWVSSDYQLKIWNGKELVRPLYNDKQIVMAGNMDVYENLLLVADLSTVMLFDGTDWHTIVKPYS